MYKLSLGDQSGKSSYVCTCVCLYVCVWGVTEVPATSEGDLRDEVSSDLKLDRVCAAKGLQQDHSDTRGGRGRAPDTGGEWGKRPHRSRLMSNVSLHYGDMSPSPWSRNVNRKNFRS